MAEVLSVYNPASASVDGTFTLAANTAPWAAGDPVEEPHFYQQLVYGDTEYITQFVTAADAVFFCRKVLLRAAWAGRTRVGDREWGAWKQLPRWRWNASTAGLCLSGCWGLGVMP